MKAYRCKAENLASIWHRHTTKNYLLNRLHEDLKNVYSNQLAILAKL